LRVATRVRLREPAQVGVEHVDHGRALAFGVLTVDSHDARDLAEASTLLLEAKLQIVVHREVIRGSSTVSLKTERRMKATGWPVKVAKRSTRRMNQDTRVIQTIMPPSAVCAACS